MKTIKAIFFIIILIFLQNDFSTFAQSNISKEEYEVYFQTLVEINYVKNKKQPVISKQTTVFGDTISLNEDLVYVSEQSQKLSEETINSFKRISQQKYELNRKLVKGRKYKLIDNLETAQLLKGGKQGWINFYKKYPNSLGIVEFSRVIFNSTKDEAFLYIALSCGEKCGEGYYIILAKKNKKWKIEKKIKVLQLG